MSTYVENKVKCDCGHEGIIHLHEGDGPFNNFWEKYSLENLDGESFESDSPVNMIRVLEEMKVNCPKCKNKIEKKHLSWL